MAVQKLTLYCFWKPVGVSCSPSAPPWSSPAPTGEAVGSLRLLRVVVSVWACISVSPHTISSFRASWRNMYWDCGGREALNEYSYFAIPQSGFNSSNSFFFHISKYSSNTACIKFLFFKPLKTGKLVYRSYKLQEKRDSQFKVHNLENHTRNGI